MPATAAFPPAAWDLDACLSYLHGAADGEVAAVSDDDLSDLFHPDLLDASLGKAWNPNQPRNAAGRWTSGAGATGAERTVGQVYADDHGVTGSHKIAVQSSRVTKYAGHATVESYVSSHPKGRAHALRQLAADHKAGRIAFQAPDLGAGAPRMKTRVGVLRRLGDAPASPAPAATGYSEAKPEARLQATYKGKAYPGDAAAAGLLGVKLDARHEGTEGYKAVQQRLKLLWGMGQDGRFNATFDSYLRDAQSTFGKVKPIGPVPFTPRR